MSKVQIIDPTTDIRWDNFVASQKQGMIFHTSAWARVVKETYGYLPRYYVLENEDGRIAAALPFFLVLSRLTGKRLVCLPFSDYCGPLGEDESAIATLLSSATQEVETGKISYLEIRGWHSAAIPAQPALVRHNYFLNYVFDLGPDLKAVKAKLEDSIRRNIRKADQNEITIRFTSSEPDIDKFYELHVMTRKKLGVFPQPRIFFKNLARHLLSQNLGITILAEFEGKPIAGAIFLMYKDTIYYKYNASNKKYLRKRANQLITWEAIQYAFANNYKIFDFGRCSLEEVDLRTYKSRWGAREVSLPYYYYPKVKGITAIPEGSIRYQFMGVLSRVMTLGVFRFAGSFLYKHFG